MSMLLAKRSLRSRHVQEEIIPRETVEEGGLVFQRSGGANECTPKPLIIITECHYKQ